MQREKERKQENESERLSGVSLFHHSRSVEQEMHNSREVAKVSTFNHCGAIDCSVQLSKKRPIDKKQKQSNRL